jgi:hypothetical protein
MSKGLEVFTDMSNEAYHGRKSHISRSTASRYRGVYGGRAQRFEEKGGRSTFDGNKSTDFGSLVDTAFEAEARGMDWRSRCAVAPDGVLTSNGQRRGKAFQEWKASLPANAIECSDSDYAKVGDIIASIREHKIARQLLESITETQLSVFWTDDDGHDRKARADGVNKSEWFDLKTTSSDWRELKYSFRRFFYHWQAAWYTDAALAAGWPPFTFHFIVAQTFAPFDVSVFFLTPDEIERARHEIRKTLADIRHRRETGEYVADTYHAVRVLELD